MTKRRSTRAIGQLALVMLLVCLPTAYADLPCTQGSDGGNTWQRPGYTHLPPGRHLVSVPALNADTVWGVGNGRIVVPAADAVIKGVDKVEPEAVLLRTGMVVPASIDGAVAQTDTMTYTLYLPIVHRNELPLLPEDPNTQIWGRLFAYPFDSPGVLANTNTGKEIVEENFNIHFDVICPPDFTADDQIRSPIEGRVDTIYPIGNEGWSIQIKPTKPIVGVEALVTSVGKNMNDVSKIVFQIAHLIPLVNEGDSVNKGDGIGLSNGLVKYNAPRPKIAPLIVVYFKDGDEYQFSPCGSPNNPEVPNNSTFCGECVPWAPPQWCP